MFSSFSPPQKSSDTVYYVSFVLIILVSFSYPLLPMRLQIFCASNFCSKIGLSPSREYLFNDFFRTLSGFKLNNHSEKEFYFWTVEKNSKWEIKCFHLTFLPEAFMYKSLQKFHMNKAFPSSHLNSQRL